MHRAAECEIPIELQQAYWDQRWSVQRSPNEWQRRRAEAILAMLRELRLERPRILDLGCATGWMTNLLSDIGSAQGLDLSEAAIAIARSQYPTIQFTVGDLYSVPLANDPVDVVVCQEVIAHVSDQVELVTLSGILQRHRERQVVGSVLEQRVGRDFHFVIKHVPLER